MTSNSRRQLILSIQGFPNFLNIFTKNCCIGETDQTHVQCVTYFQLFDKLRSSFNLKNVKACIFRTLDYELLSYKEAYEYRIQCSQFCESNGIFCLFGDEFHLNVYACLMLY